MHLESRDRRDARGGRADVGLVWVMLRLNPHPFKDQKGAAPKVRLFVSKSAAAGGAAAGGSAVQLSAAGLAFELCRAPPPLRELVDLRLVEVDVEAGDLEFGFGQRGEFGGHFFAGRWESVPMRGAVDLGDESGFGEIFEIFVVADAIGVEAGIGHQVGLPRFVTETKIVEIAAENVGDGDGVRANAVAALDAAEFGEKRSEILAANVLENAVGPDEIDGGRGDSLERFDAAREIGAAAFPQDFLEGVAAFERWRMEAVVAEIVRNVAICVHVLGGERRRIDGVGCGSAEGARDDGGRGGETGTELQRDEGLILAREDRVFEMALKDTDRIFRAIHAADVEKAGALFEAVADGDARKHNFSGDFELPWKLRTMIHAKSFCSAAR